MSAAGEKLVVQFHRIFRLRSVLMAEDLDNLRTLHLLFDDNQLTNTKGGLLLPGKYFPLKPAMLPAGSSSLMATHKQGRLQ